MSNEEEAKSSLNPSCKSESTPLIGNNDFTALLSRFADEIEKGGDDFPSYLELEDAADQILDSNIDLQNLRGIFNARQNLLEGSKPYLDRIKPHTKSNVTANNIIFRMETGNIVSSEKSIKERLGEFLVNTYLESDESTKNYGKTNRFVGRFQDDDPDFVKRTLENSVPSFDIGARANGWKTVQNEISKLESAYGMVVSRQAAGDELVMKLPPELKNRYDDLIMQKKSYFANLADDFLEAQHNSN